MAVHGPWPSLEVGEMGQLCGSWMTVALAGSYKPGVGLFGRCWSLSLLSAERTRLCPLLKVKRSRRHK